jgi:hypothetical protein
MLKKISNSRLEGIGLIFLLISFGFQIIQEDLEGIKVDQMDLDIHEKLDDIRGLQLDQYTHSEQNDTPAMSEHNVVHSMENWGWWDVLLERRKTLLSQIGGFSYLKLWCLFIGSVIVITSKFRNEPIRS